MDIPIADNSEDVKFTSVLGLNGNVKDSARPTKCGQFLFYPLGTMIVFTRVLYPTVDDNKTYDESTMNIKRRPVMYLEGHLGDVSCLEISRCGNYLASGQVSAAGMKAPIMLWDVNRVIELYMQGVERTLPNDNSLIKALSLTIGEIYSIDFTCDSSHLISLGGRLDNTIVVWNIESGRAIASMPAGVDIGRVTKCLNQHPYRFVSAGNFHLRVWEFDPVYMKIQYMEAKLGKIRRTMTSIDIANNDESCVCGSISGEVLLFSIARDPLKDPNDADKIIPSLIGSSKTRASKGLSSLLSFPCPLPQFSNKVWYLVGGGDGLVFVLDHHLRKIDGVETKLLGGVTTITPANDEKRGFYAFTDQSSWYYLTDDLKTELRGTCHFGGINDLCFPRRCSDLLVSCSLNDIRIWNTNIPSEIIRIQVPGLECRCIGITSKGGTIVSGWSDGKIRGFYPQSGKLKYVIPSAHNGAVTALAVVDDDEMKPPYRIISGGSDGRVRIWAIYPEHQDMLISLQEHRKEVRSIALSNDGENFVSASADGSCIVWDLEKQVRTTAVFAMNVFEGALFHADGSQVVTCGSSMKLTYWDIFDGGNPIREVSGATASILCMDVSQNGDVLVTGGHDRRLMVWNWDEGVAVGASLKFPGSIRRCKIAPNNKFIAVAGADGSLGFLPMPTSAGLEVIEEPIAKMNTEIRLKSDRARAQNLARDAKVKGLSSRGAGLSLPPIKGAQKSSGRSVSGAGNTF